MKIQKAYEFILQSLLDGQDIESSQIAFALDLDVTSVRNAIQKLLKKEVIEPYQKLNPEQNNSRKKTYYKIYSTKKFYDAIECLGQKHNDSKVFFFSPLISALGIPHTPIQIPFVSSTIHLMNSNHPD